MSDGPARPVPREALAGRAAAGAATPLKPGLSLARYILIARILHWIIAVLMIVAIGLGLYGDGLPYGAGAASAYATLVYALHKTVGVAALVVALPFAVWLFLSPAPRRPAQAGWPAILWRLSYWGLFFGMLLLPLTGGLLHSSGPSWGFAPILWPLPPRVPGIPDGFASHPAVAAFHRDAWWLFAGLTTVHVVLYFKRRRDRRRGTGRPAPARAGAARAWLLRLSPAAGLAMWVIVAAVTRPE